MESLKDILVFIKERKAYWLAPVILILLILGAIIVFGGTSSLAPFVYSLF